MSKNKVRIIGEVKTTLQPDGFTAHVDEPITYLIGDRVIIVKAGWITDWASIPPWLWSFFPPMGKHSKAAVLHDYLYKFNYGTRINADNAFLAVMKHMNVNVWKRWTMYFFVRLCGWSSWVKY